jgi:predicted CoA-binding protein
MDQGDYRVLKSQSSKATIEDFLAQRAIAVVGVSRKGTGFGNSVYRLLKERGYKVFPVNRHSDRIGDDLCYSSVKAIPHTVDGVVVVVPPEQAEMTVREAAEAGIRRVWLQQGSESAKAIEFCQQYGLAEVHGQCIFMYADPVESFHKLHKWTMRMFGMLPK